MSKLLWPMALIALAMEPALANQPECTTAALLDRCEFFTKQSDKERIPLPDGTSIPNPAYSSKKDEDAEDDGPSPASMEAMQKRTKSQAEVLKALKSFPTEQQSSDEFKLAFIQSSSSALLKKWSEDKPGFIETKKTRVELDMMLPWPPNEPDAPVKRITEKELYPYLSGLPESSRSALKGALKRTAEIENNDEPLPETPRMSSEMRSQREARIKEIFEFSKDAILEEILKGRSPAQLSTDERSQYEKVRSVTMRPIMTTKDSADCTGIMGNASYDGGSHDVGVCESLAMWPDSQLVQIISHEIAHSIDACNMRFPLIKLNKEALAKLPKKDTTWPDDVRENADNNFVLSALKKNEKSDLVNFEEFQYLDDAGALKALSAKGYFDIVAEGIPANRNPNLATFQCLQNTAGFRGSTSSELRRSAQAAATADEQSRMEDSRPDERQRSENRIFKRKNRFAECNPTLLGKSQMGEVMSDAWGAKALGRWLKMNPPKTEVEKIAPIAFDAFALCGENGGGLEDNKGEHPYGRVRNDRITLTDPRVQEALGCKANPKYTCLRSLGTNGPFAQSPSSARPSKPAPAGVSQ